jgi:hypothetical protein
VLHQAECEGEQRKLLEVQGAIKESDERAKRDEASRTEHQYETKEISVRRQLSEGGREGRSEWVGA